MARHLLTNIIAASGLATVVAAATAGDVRAFTETQITPSAAQQPTPGKPAQPNVPQLQKKEGGNGISLTNPGDAKSGGTEVRVPGVGTVGVLPKLNFGLELLYGGNNNAPVVEKPSDNKDDVQIKGTITHRF